MAAAAAIAGHFVDVRDFDVAQWSNFARCAAIWIL